MGLPQHSPGWGLLSGPKWEDFLGKYLVLVGGRLSLVWLLQELGHPRNLGYLIASQGPGAPAHPGISPPVLLSQLCLSTSKPLWTQPCAGAMLAFAISEGAGDTGCAPSSGGWADGVPRHCKATQGTPEDTAPCHHHPAPTWQETLARGKPRVGVPQQSCCGDPRAHSRPPPLTSPGQGPRGSHCYPSSHQHNSSGSLPLAPLGVLGQGAAGTAPKGQSSRWPVTSC